MKISSKDSWSFKLEEIGKALVQFNMVYFLDCGTLLGFVRDNDFIQWDNDIDVGCIYDEDNHNSYLDFSKHVYLLGYNVIYHKSGIYISDNKGFELNISFYRYSSEYYFMKYLDTRFPVKYYMLKGFISGDYYYYKGYSLMYWLKSTLLFITMFLNFSKFPVIAKWSISSHSLLICKIPHEFFTDLNILNFKGYNYNVPARKEEYLTLRYGNWMIKVKDYNYITDDQTLGIV